MAKVRAATQLCPPASFTGPCLSNFLEFQPCTINDIRRVILQSSAKLCALEPINHSRLLSSHNHLLPTLHLICNNSLRIGSLPDCEKLTFITPILKKSNLDLDAASNYRPISNLTFVSMLIKRLVCYQLTSYLTDNKLFAPVQSA